MLKVWLPGMVPDVKEQEGPEGACKAMEKAAQCEGLHLWMAGCFLKVATACYAPTVCPGVGTPSSGEQMEDGPPAGEALHSELLSRLVGRINWSDPAWVMGDGAPSSAKGERPEQRLGRGETQGVPAGEGGRVWESGTPRFSSCSGLLPWPVVRWCPTGLPCRLSSRPLTRPAGSHLSSVATHHVFSKTHFFIDLLYLLTGPQLPGVQTEGVSQQLGGTDTTQRGCVGYKCFQPPSLHTPAEPGK